ncbi:MAG TPA: ATP-binding protein [Thermoanaerobaculia bacterium]|nr:ATP-binding protein [Thermoanaerobaculia bacterium]
MSDPGSQEQQDWLRVALDKIGDAVVTTDAQGRVTFMNPAAERLTGLGLGSAYGRSFKEVLHLLDETTRQPAEIPLSRPANGQAPASAALYHALLAGAGGERRIETAVESLRDDDRIFTGAVMVLRDVTDRTQAERALRKSEERYRAFIEQSSEGIWRFEVEPPVPVDLPDDEQVDLFFRHAVLAECNLVMARMYGLESEAEILGARLGQFLPATDAHNLKYLRSFIMSGYRLTGAESHEVDAEGNPKVFLNNLMGVVEDGRLVRVWGTQLDITEQKRLEEELRRRAEELVGADRRKDQFLAMLAHELRNPLAPIRNAVELMRQVETADPTFKPSREMVERQVKHLARLVDDLLDVSRINQGSIRLRKELVSLDTVLQRAVEGTRPLIESRGHELSVELPAETVRLEADPTRIEQVISNLLNNAAKYTMPGGRVWVSAAREGDEAVIRVRDSGIGVPPDVLDRVFEPFVQSDGSLARSDGGLGVGLTLVRSLVEMHGGQVSASSPGLGQGSEFVIRLPARPAADAALPAAEPAISAAGRPLRVLVVEDNIDAAESLATLLRLWNHDVHVVHDGRTAIEEARLQQPQVVLLDIGLPGLDGYQVARRLREEIGLDHTLLVAMTGYGQPEDRRRSQEAGIHHHFVKPVEPIVLRNLLAGVAVPAGWESGRPS